MQSLMEGGGGAHAAPVELRMQSLMEGGGGSRRQGPTTADLDMVGIDVVIFLIMELHSRLINCRMRGTHSNTTHRRESHETPLTHTPTQLATGII